MPKKKSRRPAARVPARSGHAPAPRPSAELGPPELSTRALDAPFDSDALAVTATPWQEALHDREPQALGLTYRFDVAPDGEPYPVTVRFRGHRLGVDGRSGPKDVLNIVREVPHVLPGSGTMSLTARVLDVEAGKWQVQAEGEALRSGRTVKLPRGTATGQTGYAPMVRVIAPGVRLGAWPAFVGAGVLLGLIAQGILASRAGMSVGRTSVVSLLACLIGMVGGKAYFLALHRDRQMSGMWTVGMAIQGFVLAMTVSALVGAAIAGLPLGRFLDVTGTGLLLGMSVGRLGCFFGGCCAGRPTASRWGLWSSDRQYGVRRIPTQLMEAGSALLLGVAATVLLLVAAPSPQGAVFVAGLSAYTLTRQVLFPLRDLPRNTRSGRVVVLVAAAAALVASLAAMVLL